MNRVDQKFWSRVRGQLDLWFSEFPNDEAEDLRGRFRDGDPTQHKAAWWELYLYRLFRQLGFQIEVHPDLPNTSAHPDFRITGPNGSFLLEAAAVFSGVMGEARHGEREEWILAALEEIVDPNFSVAVSFSTAGMARPKRREITAPVKAWLNRLDPDSINPEIERREFAFRDWRIELTPLPVSPSSRGKSSHRLVGITSGHAGATNDIKKLESTLERKRRKYGKPDEPLVFALLLPSATMDDEDIEQALLGREAWRFDPENPEDGEWTRQRNGFWMKGGRARGTRVSAVITGTHVLPWTVAKTWPRLWPNPWATHPLGTGLPFPTGVADEQGAVTYHDREGLPAEIFGLPDDWPGPEKPFELMRSRN